MAQAKIKTRLVSQLKAKGKSTQAAHAIATSVLKKSGNVKSDGKTPTAKGKKRGAMGAAGRAKDRAAKKSGKSTSAYSYNKKTNRATLKGRKRG
jgi:hypothetical protein